MFPESPLIAFRRCKNPKNILVRASLIGEVNWVGAGTDKKGSIVVVNFAIKCVTS